MVPKKSPRTPGEYCICGQYPYTKVEGATRSATDNPNLITAVGRLVQARQAGALYPNV
jgi:hypothetical protein